MRYFITGGAGFIGSNYVEHLFQNVEDLTGLTIYDKFTYAANPRNYQEFRNDPRLQVVKGDVCDFGLLEESIAEHDYVIHFAAETHVDRSIENGSEFVHTNVLGTFNVLEASRRKGIKTVIHVSTDEVYGSLPEGSAEENFPLLPNSPYAASKASSDLIARSFFMTYNFDVRITRCCNNYGKYQFPEKVIPVFVKALVNGQKLPIYGDGSNVREWIHVSDHVLGLQVVLEQGRPGETYNIGSGLHLANNDIAHSVMTAMNINGDLKSYIKDRQGHDFRYSIDSRKISSLGFKHAKDFELGLKETVDWYANNPNWWN
jgi:dTDP-glucose 4,6-dehydratase